MLIELRSDEVHCEVVMIAFSVNCPLSAFIGKLLFLIDTFFCLFQKDFLLVGRYVRMQYAMTLLSANAISMLVDAAVEA